METVHGFQDVLVKEDLKEIDTISQKPITPNYYKNISEMLCYLYTHWRFYQATKYNVVISSFVIRCLRQLFFLKKQTIFLNCFLSFDLYLRLMIFFLSPCLILQSYHYKQWLILLMYAFLQRNYHVILLCSVSTYMRDEISSTFSIPV